MTLAIYELEDLKEEDKQKILTRSKQAIYTLRKKAERIIAGIKCRGDDAIIEYTKKFDNFRLTKSDIRVSESQLGDAYANISKNTLSIIRRQIKLSKEFHKEQYKRLVRKWEVETVKGVKVGIKYSPIESAGLYIPGGLAPYPTVMQILAVPAKIAGVKKLIACVPPQTCKGEVLVAAKEAGVDNIYRIGGAVAIAAMAFGTETVPKVLKIAGPGGPIVTAAKIAVVGEVAIDMPAGPSEVLILADRYANPQFLAADLLAKLEHSSEAASVLVTDSWSLAEKVAGELENQLKARAKKGIIKQSITKYSALLVAKNLAQAIKFVNEYAPEHLELMTRAPKKILNKINNAASIFIGKYAPVAIGDYATGTNHVLPTGQGAKVYSPVAVETFMKRSQFQSLSRKGLKKLSDIVNVLGRVEGFEGHVHSVNIRLKR